MSVALPSSVRERRFLAGGTIVILVAVGYYRLVPAWKNWLDRERAETDAAISTVASTKASWVRLSTLRDTLASRNRRYLDLAPVILTGATRGTAEAALTSIVSGALVTAGLEPQAISVLEDSVRTETFARVAVRGGARGDVQGLVRFLNIVERSSLMLSARRLSVSQPDPGATPDKPEDLRIEFEVEALALIARSTTHRTTPGRTQRGPTNR